MKKVLVLMRKAPYGSFYTFEGLQTMLVMGAYDIEIGVAFVDDGVYAIAKGQDPALLDIKPLGRTFPALPDFNVDKFYICRDSLQERGLGLDDLVIAPEVMEHEAMGRLIAEYDTVLPF
jgi:tRNA 2-thiouridine synthesizing protein C